MSIDLLFSNFSLFNTPEKIQKLKQAILQSAVQGKLVPQDPSDETASELIKKIQAEKEKLIKEGKLKTEKPLPPVSEDEIPYELPKGWEWVRLGEVTNIILGQSPPSSTYNKEAKGLPFYQGKADFGVLYPTPSTWCTSPNKIAISSDILISVRAPVGPTNLCPENSCIGRGLSAIRMILDNSNFYFLYFLKSIENKLSGKGFGTTFNAITGKDLNNLLTPLPPGSEQRRIVEKVDEFFSIADEIESKLKQRDEEIVNLNKSALNQLSESEDEEEFTKSFEFIIENFGLLYSDERNVKELRQAILQLAVQGKLVPQDPNDEPASRLLQKIKAENEKLIKEGELKKEKPLPPISEDEIPYELPDGWEWVRLGEIFDFVNGFAFKSNTYVNNSKNQIIRLGNVKNDLILLNSKPAFIPDEIAKESEDYRLKKDDILLTMTGTRGKGDYCYTALVKEKDLCEKNLFLNQRVGCLRIYPLVLTELANIFLKSKTVLDKLFESETGTANQGNIGLKAIQTTPFPLPPLNEQKRIVEKVDQLMKLCDELETKILKSKEESESLTDAILQ